MQEVTEEALFLFHTHTHLVMHVTPHTRTVTRIDHTHTLLIKVCENISDTSSLALLWAWTQESVIPSPSRSLKNHGVFVLCPTWECCEVHGTRWCRLNFGLCCDGKADGDRVYLSVWCIKFAPRHACDLFKFNHPLSLSAHEMFSVQEAEGFHWQYLFLFVTHNAINAALCVIVALRVVLWRTVLCLPEDQLERHLDRESCKRTLQMVQTFS